MRGSELAATDIEVGSRPALANACVSLVGSAVSPSGQATHLFNLARLLDRQGLLDTVVCPQPGYLFDRLRAAGLPAVVVPFTFAPRDYAASAWRLLRGLSRSRGCVVHLHGRLATLLAAPSMAVLRQRYFVATVHQFAGVARGGLKEVLETAALRHMDGVAAVSQALAAELRGRLGAESAGRVTYLPNWIEVTGVRGPAGVAGHGHMRILAAGRLSREKGMDVLLDAMAELRHAGRAISCDIAGSGPEEAHLRRQIDRLGLENSIRLLGDVADVHSLLACHDLLAIPSRSESFGIVALEAFAAGLPVVAAEVPGLNEVVCDDCTGLTFRAGSASALAAAIVRLSETPGLAKRLTTCAQKALDSYVPSPELSSRVVRFYEGAVARR